MRRIWCIIALAVLMAGRPAQLFACSCGPSVSAPVCELFSKTHVVFLGTSLERVPDPAYPPAFLYRFSVEKVYKGLPPDTREILVNPDNFTSCQTEYPTGVSFLVLASPLSDSLGVVISGGCSGSRRASAAGEDIQFLDNYLRGEAQTTIHGAVLQYVPGLWRPGPDEGAPLAGAVVMLQNSLNRFVASSESDGSFKFEGVPPGRYQVSARLESYTPKRAWYDVEVMEGLCREVFIHLDAKSRISGMLLDHLGRPMPRTRVELLRKNTTGTWYISSQFWKQTDTSGVFRFEDLPSGEYLVGYELWGGRPSENSEYGTRYFPGVDDQIQATVIKLEPQQSQDNLLFALGTPHHKRRMRIVVTWPDGSAPGANLLQIFNKDSLLKNLEGENHNGVYDFTGYQERDYAISARYWVDNLRGSKPSFERRISKTQTFQVPSGKDDVEIRLVLSAPSLRE